MRPTAAGWESSAREPWARVSRTRSAPRAGPPPWSNPITIGPKACVNGSPTARAPASSGQARRFRSSGAGRPARRRARVEDLATGLDLVVETVPEHEQLKRNVLAAAERRAPSLLATNTSALSIDDLAAGLRRPEAFCGMHFFNPVWSIHLVEIVRGTATAEARLRPPARPRIGKEAIVVRNVAGFATSRLDNMPHWRRCACWRRAASKRRIDRAAVLAYGHPIGPLRLSDVVGLDVRLDIARHLSTVYGERYAPPAILETLVARGDLGRKTGRGFFDWTADKEEGA